MNKPNNQSEAKKFQNVGAQSIRELSLVRKKQGYPKKGMKQKIKSVEGGYRDLAIGIKGIQSRTSNPLVKVN